MSINSLRRSFLKPVYAPLTRLVFPGVRTLSSLQQPSLYPRFDRHPTPLSQALRAPLHSFAPIPPAPTLDVVRMHGNFEGGDVVAAPKFTNRVRDRKDPEQGVVVRSRQDAEKLGLGAHTQKPAYFVGYGYRNDDSVLEELAKKLNVILIGLPLGDPTYFHADTCIASYPDSIAIYAPTLQHDTKQLLNYLYGSRITELDTKQAQSLGANGRLLRDKKDPSKSYYFYTGSALDAAYFSKVAKTCGATMQIHKIKLASGDAFVAYRLHYTQQTLLFVPMPTSQVLLGGGSVSCITQVTPAGIVMVPPRHFRLSRGQNPMESANIGKLNPHVAMAEYRLQKGRFEAFGFKVIEARSDERYPEAVYTRDAGHTFIAQNGTAYDPAAFGPPAPGGKAMFVEGQFAHRLRQGEERGMLWELLRHFRLGRCVI
jgi:N-dimethylarginine dimethylaminohydrolase